MNKPIPGICVDGKVNRVIDGDTIEVEITRKIKVRLLDNDNYNNKKFGCAEINTDEGVAAQAYLVGLVGGKTVRIFIPTKSNETLLDFHTFDRILGDIFLDELNVSQALKEAGHAKANQKEDRKVS